MGLGMTRPEVIHEPPPRPNQFHQEEVKTTEEIIDLEANLGTDIMVGAPAKAAKEDRQVGGDKIVAAFLMVGVDRRAGVDQNTDSLRMIEECQIIEAEENTLQVG